MNYIADIVEDLKRYSGNYVKPVSKLGSSLEILVKKHSSHIYFDEKLLQSSLNELGVLDFDIYKVCIMTKVTGFRELLERDKRTGQSDIDRFVRNAIEETGLTRTTILGLTCDMASSVNIAFKWTGDNLKIDDDFGKKSYVIPVSFYEAELKKVDFTEEGSIQRKDVDLDVLQSLAEAGIPKAKFILGYYILSGAKSKESSDYAKKMLMEAAEEGCMQANMILGDYYFNQGYKNISDDAWRKAYKYYTGFGTLALNEKRQNAVSDILNQKRVNRSTLILSIIFGIITVVLFLYSPGAPVYNTYTIFKWFGIILSALIMIFAILWHKYYVYDEVNCLRIVPVALFTVWCAYTLIRILF